MTDQLFSFSGRESKPSVDVSACLNSVKSETSTNKSRIKSENKSSDKDCSSHSALNSGYNADDQLYKQSINKLNSNQEESLLLLSSVSSASTSTPAFDNQRNHTNNNSNSVVGGDSSSMHYSGVSGQTSVISSLRSAYSDTFYSAGLQDHQHHQHQAHPSVIQTTAMVASRMSPITPPSSMKYSNMELPGDMYHPAVASTPPYHDSMGDESPLHYSTLNNAINPNYSHIMLNNNNNINITNNNHSNNLYNSWAYDVPLNLRQKPDSVSPHNTIIKHEHIIDNRTITLDHHPETLHISSNESTAVAMRGNNTGVTNNFSVTNVGEGFQEHGHGLVDHTNVLADDHEEHTSYLTLNGPSDILVHHNIKDSPYHNNNNNSIISTNNNNNNTTGNQNHSSSGDSRSPNAYDAYDTGINSSLTQLTPVPRLYSPSSTDHPSVIHHGYFDSISPAR